MERKRTDLNGESGRETIEPRLFRDPLFLRIIGTAIMMAIVIGVLYAYWGHGPVVAEIPWLIPVANVFTVLTVFMIAFLAIGRHQVLREPSSYWVGIAYAGLGIGVVFFILAFPGLLPEGRAILARLPSTPSWIGFMAQTVFIVFLLVAIFIRWPERQALAGRRWLWFTLAWLALFILINIVSLAYEEYLPLLIGPGGSFTPLNLAWQWISNAFLAVIAILATRNYLRSRDVLMGYVAINFVMLFFATVTAIIGARRYDLWWILFRVLTASGYMIILVGLLSEYVRLFRRENEGRLMLEAILANIPVGLAMTSGPPNYPLAIVSRHGLEMNQRPVEGLIGTPAGQHQAAWKIYLPDGVTQPLPEQMPLYRASRLGEEIRSTEMVMEVQDGRKIPVLINAAPIRDAAGQIIAAVNTWLDITERKEAEAALRESELFYRQTLESIPGMVFTTRPDGYCDYQSHQWVEYTGVPMSEQLGDGWNKLLHPEDQPRAFAAWQAAVEGEAPYNLEYRVRRHDGAYEWFKVIGRPICDEIGQIVRWFGVAMNIEELKQTEKALHKYAADLENANRDLQNFTVMASHDLQEPLRKIEALGDSVLSGASGLDENLTDRVQRMRKSAQQMRKMVDALLQLSLLSTDPKSFQVVDLHQIILEILAGKKEQIERSGGAVEVGDLPVIEADPLQMRRLFQHLIENALKFQPPGGKPRVTLIYHQPTAGFVEVLVEDNGIGFDEAHAGQLFEPFKRLVGKNQPQYDGVGIGLAICRWIVERHGGVIVARSKPGQGTTIIVTLPVQQQYSSKNEPDKVIDDENPAAAARR